MSLKRAISFSFLLLANILLLAHLVVPHHHHEHLSVCFCDFQCNDIEVCTHTQPHEHEKNSIPQKCCFIDNAYPPANNNIKHTCRPHKNCDCGQVFFALIATPLYTHDFVDDTIIHFRQNPFVPLFYSEFISQSLGLRAPPTC